MPSIFRLTGLAMMLLATSVVGFAQSGLSDASG